MDVVDELREEFREGWREGVERGGARDELHRFGAWTRSLPGRLARFALRQLRALWRVAVVLLRDALRGSPVLAGILVRGLARGGRAAVRASAAAPASAPAKPEPTAPAPKEGREETQLASAAPAGPPWKRRKGAAKAPAKQAPAAPSDPTRGGLADLLERFAIGFVALAVVAAFGGMALNALGDVLAPYASGITFGVVVVWCFAATMVAPRADEAVDEEDQAENPIENDHETAGEQPQEIDPWPLLRATIRNCVEEEVAAGAGGFRDVKGRGVRLDDLLAPLQCRGVIEAVDRKAVMDLLERSGITYREQIKFRIGGKQKNAPGVHVDDLAKDLGYRPRLPVGLVPDLTPQPGPSRELEAHLG